MRVATRTGLRLCSAIVLCELHMEDLSLGAQIFTQTKSNVIYVMDS